MAIMKFKYIYSCAFALALLLILGSNNSAKAEVIRQLDADIKLNIDCSLDIAETIKMDFEDSRRHGIFRIIPVEYSRYGGNYSLLFQLISVTDENNQPIAYVESRAGSDVNIKIGDASKLLTGVHIYRIHYSVRRAVNFFNKSPEIYWNVTGNDWPFKIERASAWFYPPYGVKISDIRTACFAGSMGSTTSGKINKSNEYVKFQAQNLDAGSGLTMVAQLPIDSVVQPTFWQEIAWFLGDWWPLIVLPIALCAYILPIIFQRTHDPDGNQAIAVEWSPPKDLTPAEVGTLIDESCDMQDIVSTLIDMAARGYLKIREIQAANFLFFSNKDYLFTKEDAFAKDDVLLPHERKFLDALFRSDNTEVKLSDLRDRFYIYLPNIRAAIYQSLTSKGLFVENPEAVRSRYKYFAIFIVFCAGIVFSYFAIPNHTAICGGLIIAAIILLFAAQFMPARTRAGWKKRAECLGFQRFVRLAEKDRIAVLAKDDPTIFGRLLPFAMVLGAADQWADAFHGLLSQPPSWYIPYGYGTANYNFSSRDFVHNLGQGMNTMGQTFTSMPTSSSAGSGGSGFSGGFSGGGFGGGGGGSW